MCCWCIKLIFTSMRSIIDLKIFISCTGCLVPTGRRVAVHVNLQPSSDGDGQERPGDDRLAVPGSGKFWPRGAAALERHARGTTEPAGPTLALSASALKPKDRVTYLRIFEKSLDSHQGRKPSQRRLMDATLRQSWGRSSRSWRRRIRAQMHATTNCRAIPEWNSGKLNLTNTRTSHLYQHTYNSE